MTKLTAKKPKKPKNLCRSVQVFMYDTKVLEIIEGSATELFKHNFEDNDRPFARSPSYAAFTFKERTTLHVVSFHLISASGGAVSLVETRMEDRNLASLAEPLSEGERKRGGLVIVVGDFN